MLYISRHIGKDKYGVVDTDDYIETVCTYRDICNAVLLHGIEIKGVSRATTHIQSIEVYQNPAFANKAMSKVNVLLGVELKISGFDLVGIGVPNRLMKPEVTIRLSDFVRSCSSSILQVDSIESGTNLILVLDDKVKITNNTFVGISNIGNIFLDVRDVTHKATLDKAYFADAIRGNQFLLSTFMIDHSERLEFYEALGVVNNGMGAHPASFKMANYFSDFDKTCEQLEKALEPQFLKLVREPMELRSTQHIMDWTKLFMKDTRYKTLVALFRNGKDSYADIGNYADHVFWYLKSITTKRRKKLDALDNYLKYFRPSPELCGAVIQLCRDTMTFANNYYTNGGL